MQSPFMSVIQPQIDTNPSFQYLPAETFPRMNPVEWFHSHMAVGGWSPLRRLSGMLTAHMTEIAPQNGFAWHPHRGLEIYTWVLEGALYHEDTTGGKGVIREGELQRMFSGHWIEHQELNMNDESARVIQIWFAADPIYRDVEPHYQQLSRAELPVRQIGDGTVYSLIGDGSPMESHEEARLTATYLDNGTTSLEAPRVGEDLFLYITDGAGEFTRNGATQELGLYDVILANPSVEPIEIKSDGKLRFLSFYLPSFLV